MLCPGLHTPKSATCGMLGQSSHLTSEVSGSETDECVLPTGRVTRLVPDSALPALVKTGVGWGVEGSWL